MSLLSIRKLYQFMGTNMAGAAGDASLASRLRRELFFQVSNPIFSGAKSYLPRLAQAHYRYAKFAEHGPPTTLCMLHVAMKQRLSEETCVLMNDKTNR